MSKSSDHDVPRTFMATVAYDGTNYGGWQMQKNAVSIQQKFEEALACFAEQRIVAIGSGRTDSGVHAEGQCVSFTLPHWRATAKQLIPAINRWLPYDISVLDCSEMRIDFNAQQHALRKRYRYRICIAQTPDPFQYRYHWRLVFNLDLEAMRQAAATLIGQHDFISFQSLGSPRKTTSREMHEISIHEREALNGRDLIIEMEANGFLYNMARNIVGTLVEIGRSKKPVSWMEQVLTTRDRRAAGNTAPALGLSLIRVYYEPHWYMDSYDES